jgi:hypothetical protein
MSNAIWLLFLETPIDQFLEDVYIPVDCEFLVARHSGDKAVLLTEVYRMAKNSPLYRQHYGAWNPAGLQVSNESLVQRRSDFHGFTITATSINVSAN